jgi:radical SAM superfamily enzyme YgiQ (UPF0313 family)
MEGALPRPDGTIIEDPGRMHAALVSTYDLGHQPFGLASAAAWLEAAGCTTRLIDLAVERLDEAAFRLADLVGFYLPMHTATRLAVPLIRRVRALNRDAHICAFGLYAPLNDELLYRLGVDTVIGGEFEEPLSRLCRGRAGDGADRSASPVSLAKQRFKRPLRSGLPPLSSYATLILPDDTRKQVGFTEATRGCKHYCRHCPVVPVYGGRFFVIQQDVVLADIRQQVAAGATHISFGDPDFFNGTGHARALIEALHREFPDLTYDVTIKIEHLLQHAGLLPLLRDTGCLFVTSAVESVDDYTLDRLDKGHCRADFIRVAEIFRAIGLVLAPTFVAFSPWLTPAGYLDLLRVIAECGLVEGVAPVQFAIRLLIPAGSRLLQLPEIREVVGPYDQEMLCFPWTHRDPRVDALCAAVDDIVQLATASQTARAAVFEQIWDCARAIAEPGDQVPSSQRALPQTLPPGRAVPQMSEPWYCCAEPTSRQRSAY